MCVCVCVCVYEMRWRERYIYRDRSNGWTRKCWPSQHKIWQYYCMLHKMLKIKFMKIYSLPHSWYLQNVPLNGHIKFGQIDTKINHITTDLFVHMPQVHLFYLVEFCYLFILKWTFFFCGCCCCDKGNFNLNIDIMNFPNMNYIYKENKTY